MGWIVPDQVLVAIGSDNHVKTFDVKNFKLLGGGSLSRRLDKSSLTCMEVDQENATVYMGTTNNSILIYSISKETYNPKHIQTIKMEPDDISIVSLLLTKEYLFAAHIYDVIPISISASTCNIKKVLIH